MTDNVHPIVLVVALIAVGFLLCRYGLLDCLFYERFVPGYGTDPAQMKPHVVPALAPGICPDGYEMYNGNCFSGPQ